MMKTNNEKFTRSVLTLAVRSALTAMLVIPVVSFAQATTEDPAAALKRPDNYIELGLKNINGDSAKFGEYNGLNKSGYFAIGNFSIRGGDAYTVENGTTRWAVIGNDLGTTSRDFATSLASQGSWGVGLKFDQLQHNVADGYQTPFVGTMGGNVFTLPSNFGIINTTALTGKTNPLVGTRNMNAAQVADFHDEDVATTRKNSGINAEYVFDTNWNLKFEFNELDQSGAKLLSSGSSGATTGTGAAGTWVKEAMVTLMNPTNYKTDTFNLSVNWMNDKAHFTGSYYASLFSDGYNSVSWQNPMGTGSNTTGVTTTTLAGGYQPNMMSTAPSNGFHQLNLNGGYFFNSATKLVGGVSYGRSTQNDQYLVDLMQVNGLPATSANGLVVTTNANIKLTEQAIKDLNLSASYKYNERDNRTPSNVYKMLDLGGGSRLEINTPYSYKKSDFELAGDYRISRSNSLRASYNHDTTEKWCDNVAGFGASPAGANCVIVPSSKEDKFGLAYRLKTDDSLNFNLSYVRSNRTSTYDHNALTPLNDNVASNGAGIVNASNYRGYNAFFDASRDQDLVKLGVNWQAAEKLNLTFSSKYTGDKYTDSALGVQKGRSGSANLDAAYNYSDNGILTAYFSAQERQRDMLSGASGLGATDNATSYAALVAPNNIWSNHLSDRDHIFGLHLKHSGLMAGKLEINGDFSTSVGRSMYTTQVPYYVPTATAPTCSNATLLQCGSTPEIYNKLIQFKLGSDYQLTAQSRLSIGLLHQKQDTNDYYYNVYQMGYSSSTMLPTNQQAPNYSINAVFVSYSYHF